MIISKATLLIIYEELRDIIYIYICEYMKIVYGSGMISSPNNREYFSVDESLIRMVDNYGC